MKDPLENEIRGVPPYTHAALGLGTDKQKKTTYVLESYVVEGIGLFFLFSHGSQSCVFFELVVGEGRTT